MGEPKLMRCGCVAMGRTKDGRPVCVTHYPSLESQEEREPLDLQDRVASCVYCKAEVPSKLTLPFFTVHPDRTRDSFYCGCRGWD